MKRRRVNRLKAKKSKPGKIRNVALAIAIIRALGRGEDPFETLQAWVKKSSIYCYYRIFRERGWMAKGQLQLPRKVIEAELWAVYYEEHG